ncbi:hypothetical protein GCM10023340_17010 [Nocardioides marinquilinus]|uniref:Response regulator transcription factor n=1 Tax=Nocardioides marinquilinus TaxID=1210400 RepID=A0ABP9PGM9_9ACTN
MSSPLIAVIAEDDPDVRDLIRMVLEQSGFQIVLADDGVSAIDAVRDYEPMLTTLDVNMPGIDGFAVAKRLREFSQTYLIMITSLTQEVDIIRGFEAGADDYLVKPFRPRELRARADSMLRRARYTDQSLSEAGGRAPLASNKPAEPESWVLAAAREFRDEIAPQPYTKPLETPPAVSRTPSAYAGRRVAPHESPQPAQPAEPAQPAAQPAQPAAQPAQPAAPAAQPAAQPEHHPVPQPPPAPATAPAENTQVDVQGNLIRYGALTVDTVTGGTSLSGSPVQLTPPETEILLSLLRTGRRVRSKADLVLAVRGQTYVTSYFVNEADKRAVDGHVTSLKRKLGDDGAVPRWIETVKGVGYRLVPLT